MTTINLLKKAGSTLVRNAQKTINQTLQQYVEENKENPMDLNIVSKGQSLDLQIVSKQQGTQKFYFGAGWDKKVVNGVEQDVDLDLVAAATSGGKLTAAEDFVYFGNRATPHTDSLGIFLTEDNTTGDGDGDDEAIVVDAAKVPAHIDTIFVGLCAYKGGDFADVPNVHFRVCDGDSETSPQVADVQMSAANTGDTVLRAFKLVRTGDHFVLENIAQYEVRGFDTAAITGFANAYK